MILTKVTGTTFGKRQDTIRYLYDNGFLEKDTIIDMIPEPTCKFDPNARRLEINSYVIGYLDKECAEMLKIMHDNGINYIAFVDFVSTYKDNVGIRIALRKIDDNSADQTRAE